MILLSDAIVGSSQASPSTRAGTSISPETRLSPDGRLEPDNAVILLNLRAGRNEIVLAVGNDWRPRQGLLEPSHYGWATEARFGQTDGLDLH